MLEEIQELLDHARAEAEIALSAESADALHAELSRHLDDYIEGRFLAGLLIWAARRLRRHKLPDFFTDWLREQNAMREY